MIARVRLDIEGVVQGLGFRPFVYSLAQQLGLCGFVRNTPQGVHIEVEGEAPVIAAFRRRLVTERPPFAALHAVRASDIETEGSRDFEIVGSSTLGPRATLVLPDIAPCDECRSDIFAPSNRRVGYPFTNCTRCGPRYSIIRGLPYDRRSTTMRAFTMCPTCAAEYENPGDRRFHAQPNACAECGPTIWLNDAAGSRLASGPATLAAAADLLAQGSIVAMKGLGGFQLLVDASDETAVSCLRKRKRRSEKPLAVMVPSLEIARTLAEIDAAAEAVLRSPSAPILLLQRKRGAAVAPAVAPDTPLLGLMLPHTPQHHLLLTAFGRSIVATSGNLSDEPICIDNDDAERRLASLADAFLLHDRPIERHVDDSVAHFCLGQLQLLRRARGYAPLPLDAPGTEGTALAFGSHQKNTLALATGGRIFVSQHVGDLSTAEAVAAHERTARDLPALFGAVPAVIAHDLHPDYASTTTARRVAATLGARTVAVQHHHAHLVACMLDNGLDLATPVLGVCWDGAGLGADGTVWGGEFLHGCARGYVRVASLRPFRLPGGDAVAREPRRSALSLLRDSFGDLEQAEGLPSLRSFSDSERSVLSRMLASGLQSPLCTSAGRLIDGLASLLGLGQRVSFEGQAAIRLEHLAAAGDSPHYDLPLVRSATRSSGWRARADKEPIRAPEAEPWRLDWRPLIRGVVADARSGVPAPRIAMGIHRALAQGIVSVVGAAAAEVVVLSGGCFQNRLLTRLVAEGLRGNGARACIHRELPPNDGAVSAGQVAIAAAAVGAMR